MKKNEIDVNGIIIVVTILITIAACVYLSMNVWALSGMFTIGFVKNQKSETVFLHCLAIPVIIMIFVGFLYLLKVICMYLYNTPYAWGLWASILIIFIRIKNIPPLKISDDIDPTEFPKQLIQMVLDIVPSMKSQPTTFIAGIGIFGIVLFSITILQSLWAASGILSLIMLSRPNDNIDDKTVCINTQTKAISTEFRWIEVLITFVICISTAFFVHLFQTVYPILGLCLLILIFKGEKGDSYENNNTVLEK